MLHGAYLELHCEGEADSAPVCRGRRWRPAKRCKRQDRVYQTISQAFVELVYHNCACLPIGAHTNELYLDARSVLNVPIQNVARRASCLVARDAPGWHVFSLYHDGPTALNVRRAREAAVISNLPAMHIKNILAMLLLLN